MVFDLKYVQIGIALYFCNDFFKNQIKAGVYIREKSLFKCDVKNGEVFYLWE